MQQSPADLASSMSMQAQSSISASVSSSLESSSFDSMDMMMAGMDSSTNSEQMMKMAIALIILQMINGGEGASVGESGTDLLGMLNAETLLQSAGQGSTQTSTQTAEASITLEQSASVSYAQNAYASSSASTQDPNQRISNVDVMI